MWLISYLNLEIFHNYKAMNTYHNASIIHKMITKILLNRLRLIMTKLIDFQHIGFMIWCNITDNILVFQLAYYFTKATSHEAMFIKLYFSNTNNCNASPNW